MPGLPATPRYIYVVASSDFENTAGLRCARRLTACQDMHSRPVLALTTQLADHAGVPGLPATPRYIYVVASSDFENTAGLRAGLRPPALPPLAAPGGATAELPAAPDDALVAAAIITPSPAAPSDAPADMPDDIQTDGGEDAPDDLLLLLFEAEMIKLQDLDGASATIAQNVD